MKTIQVFIFTIIIFAFFSSCGKKNDNVLLKKDSTSTNKDTSSKPDKITNLEQDTGYYKSKVPLDEYLNQHPNLKNHVEFADFIKMIALDKYNHDDKSIRLQKWTLFDTQSNSPVNWFTNKLDHKKVGEVILQFNGKPAEIQGIKIVPIIWTISMSGNEEGADKIITECSILSHSIGEFDIQNTLSKNNIKFNILKSTGDPPRTGKHETLSLITGEKEFKILVPNKEPMWMVYRWSCETTGCTANFVIYYNENQYKEESEKQNTP
jgi:hypothetical protein